MTATGCEASWLSASAAPSTDFTLTSVLGLEPAEGTDSCSSLVPESADC